jgi:hypothetical protein
MACNDELARNHSIISIKYDSAIFLKMYLNNVLFLLFLGDSVFCSRVFLAGLQVVSEYISRCNGLANVTLGK